MTTTTTDFSKIRFFFISLLSLYIKKEILYSKRLLLINNNKERTSSIASLLLLCLVRISTHNDPAAGSVSFQFQGELRPEHQPERGDDDYEGLFTD